MTSPPVNDQTTGPGTAAEPASRPAAGPACGEAHPGRRDLGRIRALRRGAPAAADLHPGERPAGGHQLLRGARPPAARGSAAARRRPGRAARRDPGNRPHYPAAPAGPPGIGASTPSEGMPPRSRLLRSRERLSSRLSPASLPRAPEQPPGRLGTARPARFLRSAGTHRPARAARPADAALRDTSREGNGYAQPDAASSVR